MSEEKYIAAIEISSSKIIGTVGRMQPGGRLDVIAVEQEKAVEAVRMGIIQNVEDTSNRIARILEKLERKPAVAPRKIKAIYTGISGRSLRSISKEVSIEFPEDTEMDNAIIEQLRSQALANAIDSSLEVIDAVPRSFFIGKTETHNPIGMIGSGIRATYDLIVCRPQLMRNIQRCVSEKLGLEIAGVMVTALAAGQTVLTAEDKRLGCMLVDLGAETTTVTIYKDGHLVYFATLPLGSRHITRDLTSLSLLEERAEEIKITSGNAVANATASTLNIHGVKFSDVSNLVTARSEEIVANIVEQISYADLKGSDLPGGIICIGGGFKLNGMLDLLGRQSNLNVRRGQLPPGIVIEDTKAPSSESIEVVSILYAGGNTGAVECLELPKKQDLPTIGTDDEPGEDTNSGKGGNNPRKPKEPSWIASRLGAWKDKFTKIVIPGSDDSEELI